MRGLAGKILIVVVLLGAIGAVLYMRQQMTPSAPSSEDLTEVAHLPRLLDVGSTVCVPCRMMMPVMEHLRKQYAGKLEVAFIDIHTDAKALDRYGVTEIPTQIYFDSKGVERFRHVGFYPEKDLVAKLTELGVK